MSHDSNETEPLPNWPDQLASTLVQFAEAWQRDVPPQISQFLATGEDQQQTWDASERSQLLAELVKLDLQYRWRNFVDDSRVVMSQQGASERRPLDVECWLLETYLEQHPQLGPAAELPRSLILEEYRVRHLAGDAPGHQEYLERFPEQGAELSDRLSQLDGQLHNSQETASLALAETEPYFGKALMTTTRRSAQGLTGVFGDYELLEEIARGGMGVVYKARQISLDRTVAVKMILAGQLADDREVRRFHTEAEAAARLQHPHIVAIHEVGELQGQHYFSMDFIEGENLSERVAEGPLPLQKAAGLVRQVALAIEYAHQQGILHRDLKPQNILVDQSDHPWVTDFGLAKRIEGHSDLTGTGQVLGTPSYMPPEQAGLDLLGVGPASDVYSMGAILYELITGRAPFRAATAADTVMLVRSQDPVAPRLFNDNIPRDLETITLKCLEKEPSKRYASAAKLGDELDCYLEGKPIQARPVAAWERSWRWCRRKPTVAGIWALLAVLLLTLSIGGPLVALRQSTLRGLADVARSDERAQRKEAESQRAIAETKSREATQSGDEARRALAASERQVYLSDMLLAQRYWDGANIADLRDLLDRHGEEEKLKSFEWYYWNRLGQSELQTLPAHGDSVHCLALSADGKRIVTGSKDKTLIIWDATTGQQLMKLEGHQYPVNGVAISSDGKRIASGSADTTVIVWDAETGKQLLTLVGHRGEVMSVSFSPDGKRIVSAGLHLMKLWDASTGKELRTFDGHQGRVYSVAFSPDGEQLVSGGLDRVIRLWDVKTGEAQATFAGHGGIVWEVTFSPDGKNILSAGADNLVKIWDVESGQPIHSLTGHTDAVQAVCFSPSGEQIVSASRDRTLMVWETGGGEPIFVLKGHRGIVRDVSFSPDGKKIVSAGDGSSREHGELKIWAADTNPQALTLSGGDALIWSVAFSPDGKQLATGNADKCVKVWDLEKQQERLTLRGHQATVTSVLFDSSGQRIASCGDNTVKLWDAQSGDLLHALEGHSRRVTSAAFSPDGKRIASGSRDKTIKIWDVASGKELSSLSGHTSEVKSVAFNPDGKSVVSASSDQTVRLWDLASGKQVWSVDGHAAAVQSVAFSPDGQQIASGGMDKVVNLWDAKTGVKRFTLSGQDGTVYSVAFSPDGKRIVAGSHDATVQLWDVETGQETLTLKGHHFVVTGVCFSSDGRQIATASWDKTIKIWDARPKLQH